MTSTSVLQVATVAPFLPLTQFSAATSTGRFEIQTAEGATKAIKMPWEETKEYIRSGHESTDRYDKGSLRTIIIDEAKGIKAIIA